MSTLKVNIIQPYSGSTVSIVGLDATASNALWSGISGIPAGLVSGSYSSSMSTRITAQEDFSSSLDATFATDAEVNAATASLSGSASTARQAIADDLSTVSSSLATRVTAQEDFSSSLDNTFATEAELNAATSSLSGSASDARNQLATDYTSADSTLSASIATDIATNADSISTLDGKTLVSSSISGDAQGQLKVNGVNVNVTSLQTTSNPTFANLTGSNILVSNNLVVNGTASFALLESVTGSAKIIGDAFIVLNNNTPTERYAGLVVQDSGSANTTASLQFDGQTNDWFYEYSDDGGVTTDHGVVIFGPEYDTKGTPTYLTNGTIPKSSGSHHLVDSSITDNLGTVTITAQTTISNGYDLTVQEGRLKLGATAVTSTAAELNKLDGATVTTGEINLLDGSSAGTIVNSKAVIYGAAGEVNATKLQIGGVDVDNDIATLSLPASTTISAFGATLVDDANAAAARTTIGLGNVENTALSTYTGQGGALDNQYITNGAGYTTNVGDITGVTAGNGLTGGGTSGGVTLNIGAGTAIDVSADAVSVDLSELSTSTTNGDGDYFVVVDTSNVQRKLTKANINLSGFNNDLGTSLAVDVTSTGKTMVANTAYVVTGSSAPVTMSLPSSPSNGDLIKFANMDDRANLIARNGSKIMGLAEDFTLDIEQVAFDLVYTGTNSGWVVYGSRATS